MASNCGGCQVRDDEIMRLTARVAEASGAAEKADQVSLRNQRDTMYWRTRADRLSVELAAANCEIQRLTHEKNALGQEYEREKRARETAETATVTLRTCIVEHAPEVLTWQPIRDAMGLGEA